MTFIVNFVTQGQVYFFRQYKQLVYILVQLGFFDSVTRHPVTLYIFFIHYASLYT